MLAPTNSTNSTNPSPVPSLNEPPRSSTSSSSSSSQRSTSGDEATSGRLQRPKLGSRKSSGTMIIPRDSPSVEVDQSDEEYDEGDVRNMSPRRSMESMDKLGEERRKSLVEQAKTLQASLVAIIDRVEAVKEEHEKLEGGNKFLQSYIGELIQTSKITSAPSKKGKTRLGK